MTAGYDLYTCSCGASLKKNETKATGVHTYVETVVAPTYKDKGYTLHACSDCTESYKDTYVNQTSYLTFNEHGWGFYTNVDGEEVCSSRGAYVSYLERTYPDATVCYDTGDVTTCTAIWCE